MAKITKIRDDEIYLVETEKLKNDDGIWLWITEKEKYATTNVHLEKEHIKNLMHNLIDTISEDE